MNAAHLLAWSATGLFLGCGTKPVSHGSDAAPPASVLDLDADVDPPKAADTATTSPSSTDSGEGGWPAPHYSHHGIAELPPPCTDPQAMLGVSVYGDTSLLRQVEQAMVAHPAIEVVSVKPRPGSVRLNEAGYGTKYFAASRVQKNHYAVIADCGDRDTCLALAAMIRAVIPGVRPLLVCGDPPAISGQKATMKVPFEKPSEASEDQAAVCGRVTACAVREVPKVRDSVWSFCLMAPVRVVAGCASSPSCWHVNRCIEILRKG